MKKYLSLSLLVGLSALLFTTTASAALITPASVTGYGSYTNSAGLITDGVIPGEGTIWTAGSNVYWTGTSPYFVINLGNTYTLDKLLASVDNNDSYQIDSSLNGSDWSNLYTINSWDGNVGSGMDTFENLPVSASAKYLKIRAISGDNYYAVGELQAFGTAQTQAVPEPATMSLLGLGLLGLMGLRKKSIKV